jgi:elongation factor P--(R)-beta-lysine ligase
LSQPQSPWWTPQLHADRRPLLMARNRIIAAIRTHFEAQDFVEVTCGALQVSPGSEAHLHAFSTEWIKPDGEREWRYLHTSPEFACKKLLAAGEKRIFDFAQVYRNRERTALHAPEFTMLEWYRAQESYDTIMSDAVAMLRLTGAKRLSYRGIEADPNAEPEYLTLAEAFDRYAGFDLFAILNDRDGFAAAAEKAGVRVANDDNWSDIFSRVLVEKIEPRLGCGRPTLLYEYPACEAALARINPKDQRVAERFELYVCGVELANGFGELTDAEEQRRRFIEEMNVKEQLYGERYPLDEDFLAALKHMPPASGAALGFDRLVMLATGAPSIDQVIWTPFA